MHKTFVSVGVTILDIVGYPINQIPLGESTEIIEKIHLCAAGTAAAPAVIAAKMGLNSTLISALADDDIGHFIRYKLDQAGVDTSLLEIRDDLPSAATMLPINSEGKRPNWHMPGAFLMMQINTQAKKRIVHADHIHWGGLGLLFNVDGELTTSILKEAKSNGATVTADLIAPGPQTLDAIKAAAPFLDYFMPSIDEALEISSTNSVESAADFFINLGVKACLIKCGGDGAYLATNDGIKEKIPVIQDVNVVDTSGCGDSFCAGFNVALANGLTPIDAAHFASATAAQVASAMGSDGGVKDYNTTLAIMKAGSMNNNSDNKHSETSTDSTKASI